MPYVHSVKPAARALAYACALLLASQLVLAKAAAQTAAPDPPAARFTTSTARFRHLTQADGLVQTTVAAISQDSLGFMWFGTWDGLYRYDGRRLRRFSHQSFDSTSLVYNSVKGLAHGQRDRLYIASDGGGIDVYDGRTETFRRAPTILPQVSLPENATFESIGRGRRGQIFYDDQVGNYFAIDPSSLAVRQLNAARDARSTARAYAYAESADGTVWVGTDTDGLLAVKPDGSVTHLEPIQTGTAPNQVYRFIRGLAFASDDADRLWIATERGLRVLDVRTGEVRPGPAPLDKVACTELLRGIRGELWIGAAEGVYRFDPNSGEIIAHLPDVGNPLSVLGGEVTSLFIDRQRVLWVGTLTGVSYLPLVGPLMGGDYRQLAGLNGTSDVWTMYKGPDQITWTCQGGKLHRYDRLGKRSGSYGIGDLGLPPSLTQTGGELKYVFRLPTRRSSSSRASPMPGDSNSSRSTPSASAGEQSSKSSGDVLQYTLSSTPPLHELEGPVYWLFNAYQECPTRYDPDLERPISYCPPDTLPGLDRRQVFGAPLLASDGLAYFGSYVSGLLRFDSRRGQWKQYMYDPAQPTGLSSNVVLDVAEDSTGHVWVATYGAGLSRLDTAAQTFTHYTTQNSDLPNDVIYAVLVDARNRVWVSTNYGISVLDQTSGKFVNFGLEHGLQSMEFNAGARFAAADGEFFFGGIAGFNRFYPDSMLNFQHSAPLVLTDIAVRGAALTTSNHLAVPYLRQLSLKPEDRDVEIAFADLEFAYPSATRLRYRLVGYQDEWTEAGERRSATYTNLDPGRYTFEVQSADGTGEFAPGGPTLDIEIQFPWYRSAWAYLAYVLLLAGAGYGLYGFRQNRRREREREQQQRAEAAQLRELDRVKTNFFTNVSHEFRTPLTLISGPLDDVLRDETASLSPRHRQSVALARENATRLNDLVEELLDVSQLEAGQLRANPRVIDVAPFLEMVMAEHRALAVRKGVRLIAEVPAALPPIVTDPQHLARILGNVLSNGIKFTPAGGQVVLAVATAGVDMTFTVRDNGRGIPAAELPNVFDRFYRVDESDGERTVGTGIGLSLARELAHLAGGELTVTSVEGSGSSFTLRLPLGDAEEGKDAMSDLATSDSEPTPPLS